MQCQLNLVIEVLHISAGIEEVLEFGCSKRARRTFECHQVVVEACGSNMACISRPDASDSSNTRLTSHILAFQSAIFLMIFIIFSGRISSSKPAGTVWTLERSAESGPPMPPFLVARWNANCLDCTNVPRTAIAWLP